MEPTIPQTETPAPVKSAADTMHAFFTRQKANEGIHFSLDFPDGTPSPHYFRIRGIDSDHFRAARTESYRRLHETLTNLERKAPTPEELLVEETTVLSSLVAEWSFDQPCTPENVATFLREAPQITKQINEIAANRSRFFPNGSTNS